jgi:5-methyltetrahydropteroyltriglutamate--homocysteine methyltransferase
MVGKLRDVVKVPIPCTQTGRYPRPAWYNYNITDRSWKEMCNDPSFAEAYMDAVRTVMTDHELAGMDILTDGCMRYDARGSHIAAWDTNNLAYMGGVRRVANRPEGNIVMETIMGEEDANAFYKVSGLCPTSNGSSSFPFWWLAEEEPYVGNLGIWIETAKVALPCARSKPFKFSGPAAANAAHYIVNKTGKSDRDIYFDLARVQNKVLREIASAGCKIIQLDYPFGIAHWAAQFNRVKKDVWKDLVDAFNLEVKGVNAHIWVHFCFGAPILYSHETPPMRYHMGKVYPHIAECKADCMQSEAANTDGKYLDLELKAWKEYLSDRDYAIGAATPYDLVETAEDVDGIVNKALKYIPANKLALTTDEGIAGNGFLTRQGAIIKMKMLAEAAKKARKRQRTK